MARRFYRRKRNLLLWKWRLLWRKF
jgi:hypothetical protein